MQDFSPSLQSRGYKTLEAAAKTTRRASRFYDFQNPDILTSSRTVESSFVGVDGMENPISEGVLGVGGTKFANKLAFLMQDWESEWGGVGGEVSISQEGVQGGFAGELRIRQEGASRHDPIANT